MGHATGDGVLIAVAERIRGCIRDIDTAARLGGDEFAIILATADIDEIAGVARRLVDRISRPFHFDGRLVEIGISIGISLGPKDGTTPTRLMKNADLALYRAKADGRGIWRFYDPAMDERLQDRRSLQSDLRQALARGEFALDYQPIIDLASNRIAAAEALLRWHHPVRGLLAPASFIQLAEEAGMITAIGAWVLREACATAALWPEDMRVAVNLSPTQFRDSGLVETVDRALRESGLEPNRLELEITETTVLETNSATVDALWKLHGRGVRIALDDFGTGYSSLSYLRRFPFDKIKIDRSFIRDLGHEKDDSSIILAIIGLADSMNMVVTAEGVETAEQAALLTSYGCAQAQGYLFCRPVEPAELARIIGAADQVPAAAQ
jgi:predicted signal transduction protein with EAL and GGDEF domain